MTRPVWMLTAIVILEGAVMMALPYLSPRRMFFGVRTGAEFRATGAGRKILAQYIGWVFGWFSLAAAILIGTGGLEDSTLAALTIAPMVLALATFLWTYFRVRPYALKVPDVREAELSPERGLPWWGWLALPPFAGPAAAIFYLRAHWSEIPERYPVHFGWNGAPDRWVAKSEAAVFGRLWFSEGMLLLMLLLWAAVMIGSRKSVRPTAIPGIFVGGMYLMGAVLTIVGLMPLVRAPVTALLGLTVAFVAAACMAGWRANAMPNAPAEATPDECWTLGSIYVNSNDPAIFVQKRIGFGYTVNLGNIWSYVVLGGFGLFGAAMATLIWWSQRG
ncbi:MAG TPA: DUF5808 domain-containing protein [Bryobacteraceae bacterium]|nr:DUF5808 domain-containing protein [Bryobacteraceae bacterium]